MMQNVSSTSEAGLVRSEVEGVISFPRKRLSAFCGDYYNSTSIDEKLGVLGNECFLNGLSFVPNVVFVLVAVPVLISWNKSIFASMHVKTWVRFPHHTIRWLLMFVLIITNLFEVVAGFLSDNLLSGLHLHLYIPHIANVVGSVMTMIYYHSVEMWNSPRFLLLFMPYWLASTVIEGMKASNLNIRGLSHIYMRPHLTRTSIVVYCLLCVIELDVLRQLRYAFFKKRRILRPPESLADTNYVQSAVSLPSKATYFWMWSVLEHACKNVLELKDLGRPPESERCDQNYTRLVMAMEEEREKQIKPSDGGDENMAVVDPPLWKCYWTKMQPMLLLSGFFMLTGNLLHLGCPLLLIFIIDYVEKYEHSVGNTGGNVTLPKHGDMVEVKEFFSNGYLLSLMLFLVLFFMYTLLQAGNFLMIREGVRLRGALQLLIYTKTLSLSMWNFSSHAVSVGQIVNHLSVDANNMMFCCCVIHFVWLLPLKTLLALVMLFFLIGWSALLAGSVIILLAFLQYFVAGRLAAVQKVCAESSDRRIKRGTEMLQNIKALKLFVWERLMAKRCDEAREIQLSFLFKAACLKAAMTFISEGGPLIFLLLAFALQPVFQDEPLTPGKIFPSILLADTLSMPIQLFPVLINFIVNARTSTRKIVDFLGAVEVDNKRHHLQQARYHKAEGSERSSQSENGDIKPAASSSHRQRSRRVSTQQSGSQDGSNSSTKDQDDSDDLKHTDHETKRKRASKHESSKDSSHGSEMDSKLTVSKSRARPKSFDVQRSKLLSGPALTMDLEARPDDDKTRGMAVETAGLLTVSTTNDGTMVSRSQQDLAGNYLRFSPRPSSSQLSSHGDLRGLETTHRRFIGGVSASNSVGSGLDDDDYIDPHRDVGIAVCIRDGYFSWLPRANGEPLMSDINFIADAGQLTVVVGAPGSGKSSLIAALLGEMTCLAGMISWKPGLTVCYVGSAPWILNASFQENILFGQPLEKKRYRRVLRACALLPDIDILPDKDRTELGDKGISLCTGQKIRICIARALYSKADLVILDDPFSLLDLPTGAHIFEDGILHFCLLKRKRTVIVVTHELHFLPFAHAIYGMENGTLNFHGRLKDVKEFNPELFTVWQEKIKIARRDSQLRTQREDTANTERLILRRKIRTLEFQREVVQSVIDEEAKGDSAKHVFISGQTTHITIEEEHPGGEDLHSESQNEDDDFDIDVQPLPAAKHNSIVKKSGKVSIMMKNLKKSGSHKAEEARKYEAEKSRVVVTWPSVAMYLRASRTPLIIILFLCHMLRTSVMVTADFWLAAWSVDVPQDFASANSTELMGPTEQYYVVSYVAFIFAAIIICVVIALATELLGLAAARSLHSSMLHNVVSAPMRFFDTNSISKITSRFSSDINIIDDKLPTTLEHFIRTSLLFIATIIVNTIVTPYFIVAAFVILLGFVYLQRIVRSSYRELHKLDSITRTPLLSHCVETVAGLRTLRAFRDESRFWEEMEKHIDLNNSTHLWLNTANRWTGIRLDYLAAFMVLSSAVAGISVAVQGHVGSSLVALGITYALLMSGYWNWAFRSIVDIEVQMTAVQRIHEYCTIPSECQSSPAGEVKVDNDWPSAGEIVFNNVSIRYSGNACPVARNLDIHIQPGEKVGICGRPGCGKSSLTLSLLGMVDICDGHAYIDCVDISRIPPTLLRSRLAILPQDCVLVSGTVRYNLDPEGRRSDDEVWEALEIVNMKERIKFMSGQLDGTVSDNGDNFSVSDKQLLCLARVVLSRSKVVIIDEVMTVVNEDTEQIVHRVVRTAFSDRTVINLSHRAASLMNYDTVIVLDNGLVVECDSPQNLLTHKKGVFASLMSKNKLLNI